MSSVVETQLIMKPFSDYFNFGMFGAMMENIEVELKFQLMNFDDLYRELNSMKSSVQLLLGERQIDRYYVPSHRNFLDSAPVSEWLRVRKSSKGDFINYKKWHNESGCNAVSCSELETEVSDIDALVKIFVRLNFEEIIVVDKKRWSWKLGNAEISIDRVKGLGDYIELEACGEFKSIDDAKKYLYEKLSELNASIGEQDYKGYPYRLLKKSGITKK